MRRGFIRLTLAVALLTLGAGCLGAQRNKGKPCPPDLPDGDGTVQRVVAPRQKIVVEHQVEDGQPESKPEAKADGKPESDLSQPESAPRRSRSRPQPEPESDAEAGQPESLTGTLAALSTLGQIASLTKTTAMTRPLGSVNPGNSGLGISFTWIQIPFPWFRLFSVEESPTVTVPLSDANLIPAGANPAMLHQSVRGGSGGLSREELAAIVARELAAQQPKKPAQTDAEKQELKKRVAAQEAQIDRLEKLLESIEKRTAGPRVEESKK